MAFPFLCIITPIFDGAFDCLKLLVEALQAQSCQDFIHVCVSNGPSEKIKNFLSQQDSKYLYCELSQLSNAMLSKLMEDLGRRRDFCLKNYDAERYLFLDADIKILNSDYFAKLKEAHSLAPVLITKVKHKETIFPLAPLQDFGHMDISNYSFIRKIAKEYPYPTDYLIFYGHANDYRFYQKFGHCPFKILDFISAEKDGNNNYKRVSQYYR